MLLVKWLLVVVATVHGASSVATREFTSGTLCREIAADLIGHTPGILQAKCIMRVMT